MIDRETGRLVLGEGVEIAPSLTRQELEHRTLGQAARLNIRNEPYISYQLPSGSFQGRRVLATVYFKAQRLESVDIVLSTEPEGASWADWSLEKEMNAKAFHEVVLKDDLGEPHEITLQGVGSPMETEQERNSRTVVKYRYPWGEVLSTYDSRGGFSSIFVRYS
jgi:hypothetical protein